MKRFTLQCLVALLLSIGLFLVCFLPDPHAKEELFKGQWLIGGKGFHMFIGTFVFFLGYTGYISLVKSNRLEHWQFASYLLTIAITNILFVVWGPKWGIAGTNWGNPNLGLGFMLTVYIALNIFFWRILFRQKAIGAYLFGFFMGLLDTLVCFFSMPVVKSFF